MKRLLLILLLALTGCVVSIEKQVDGWPQDLRTTEHEVSFWEIQKRCLANAPWYIKYTGSIVTACAQANLYTHTCDIYYLKDAIPSVVEHERQHCKGGDHGGVFQTYYDTWKASRK